MGVKNDMSQLGGQDGLVQLRFSDDDGSLHHLNAHEVAEVLQGLVELTSDFAKAGAFGDGPPPELRVRPVQEGSFVIEAVLFWWQTDPTGAAAVASSTLGGTGLTLIQGIRLATKGMRAQPKGVEILENGKRLITFQDDTVEEVTEEVWNELQKKKRRTKAALRKIMAPLGDDASRLELRDGDPTQPSDEVMAAPPDFVAERPDYRNFATLPDEVDEKVTTFDTEAVLRSVDFRPGQRWRIQITGERSRLAKMEDEEFQGQVDAGLPIHKNDILDVKIREIATTKNGRMSRDWSIVKVHRMRAGGDDDGDDGISREDTPSA